MRAIDLLLSTHRRIRRVRYYRSVRSFFQLQGRCRRVSALIDASETTTQQQKYSGLPGASISDLGNSCISVEDCRVGEIYFSAECGIVIVEHMKLSAKAIKGSGPNTTQTTSGRVQHGLAIVLTYFVTHSTSPRTVS